MAADALERIRAEISEFPGCDGETECRLSDEQVRSYVGERLAALQNADFSQEQRDLYERVLFRCEFMNQQAFRLFDEHRSDQRISAVLEADAELVEVAKNLGSDSNRGGVLQKLEAAFNKRDAAMMQG